MREKADTFEVADPAKAMTRFESLLGKLVKVPKGDIKAKRKRVKARQKAKAKSQSIKGSDANALTLQT